MQTDLFPTGRLPKLAARILRKPAARLGLASRRDILLDLPPVDFRGLAVTPAQAMLRAAGMRHVIDAPLEHCRGFGPVAFPITRRSGHPFVETCRALLAEPALGYEESALAAFLAAFQPRNAAEMLGLDAAHPAFQGAPETWILPWTAMDAAEVLRRRRRNAEHRAAAGRPGAAAGFANFGPVSPERGRAELDRLRHVVLAIEADGFRFLPGADGLVRAEILSFGAEWRARIQVGQHRTAALAALGAASVPIWPEPAIVRREEAAEWPAVRAGVLSRA